MLACCKRRKTLRWHMQRPNRTSTELHPMQQRSTLPGSPARLHCALPRETLSFGKLKTNPYKATAKCPKGNHPAPESAANITLSFSSSIESDPQPHFSSPNFQVLILVHLPWLGRILPAHKMDCEYHRAGAVC